VAKSHNLGWLPAKAVAEKLEKPQAKAPELQYYFVAVRRLKLMQEPLANAKVIKTLQFNDQVERLDQNQSGWSKVRQPASGAVGWVPERNLETTPLKPRRSQKPVRKKLRPAKPTEGQPPPELEIM
jgi:hypothetical protein